MVRKDSGEHVGKFKQTLTLSNDRYKKLGNRLQVKYWKTVVYGLEWRWLWLMHFKVTILFKRRVNDLRIPESQVWKTINQINTNKKIWVVISISQNTDFKAKDITSHKEWHLKMIKSLSSTTILNLCAVNNTASLKVYEVDIDRSTKRNWQVHIYSRKFYFSVTPWQIKEINNKIRKDKEYWNSTINNVHCSKWTARNIQIHIKHLQKFIICWTSMLFKDLVYHTAQI